MPAKPGHGGVLPGVLTAGRRMLADPLFIDKISAML